MIYPLWMLVGCGIGSNSISLFAFYLFHHGMKKLNKLIFTDKAHGNTSDNHTLRLKWKTIYVVRKCTILVGFTLISTWILLGSLALFPIYTVAAIDSLINVISLLLQDSRYDKVYLMMFGCISRKKEIADQQMISSMELPKNPQLETVGTHSELKLTDDTTSSKMKDSPTATAVTISITHIQPIYTEEIDGF